VNPTVVFLSPPDQCSYLPDQVAQLQYELALDLTAAEYMTRLKAGWRRFGPVMFRHQCPACQKCESLRVPVDSFEPSTSQRRVWKRNVEQIELRIAAPVSSQERLDLFRRFHDFGHRTKGWPADPGHDLRFFTNNPFPTEEWSYFVGDRLVGVGYMDVLPEGLSAIYFFHDPEEGRRSLGTFNVLNAIDQARRRRLPHVYLGYYVEGCRSLEYKARFAPHQKLDAGVWS
jgi:arginine-tRNA-protein transferase